MIFWHPKIWPQDHNKRCSCGRLCVLSLKEKKFSDSLRVSISVSIMAECNHEESPHITAALQHNEYAAQPASISFYNYLISIVVGQITQHAQYLLPPGKALSCGHSSPLIIIFIIISQLRGALPAIISSVFPPSFPPFVIHHSPGESLTVSPRSHLTFAFAAFGSKEFLKPN